MPGVYLHAFEPYTSGPNCTGGFNDYGPMQVCPSGSHISSLTCQMTPGSGGGCTPTAQGAMAGLRVLAPQDCTHGAWAFLVATCIAD
jgi:hypothetical protein